MEDWIAALKVTATRELYSKPGLDPHDLLRGKHAWVQASHARPTYCNVCREALSGVTSHGLSCEICKLKVHKRCVLKAINNCKWSTLASIGKDIIEDKDGNLSMPHQWMEGNLPVSAKCAVCDRTCGSVLRLQDWRCLWCKATVHTACRPNHSICCSLGPCRLSTVPPTSLHSVGGDEAWEGVRPPACSPLLVFVNSKSGDNQGVKFLRRFKQLLNPAQVFDLIGNGPGLGLRLFRHFDPFRILVCSGDGSVGWVLSEIDRLNMQKQCQIGVLPLGTGNDLARVLGWGASCDDDTHLPQLLEKYEKASTKILDRWSIMTFERSISTEDGSKITLTTTSSTTGGVNPASGDSNQSIGTYEDRVTNHLTRILVSDDNEEIIQTAKALCDVIKALSRKAAEGCSEVEGDQDFIDRCHLLKSKLDKLLQTVQSEPSDEEVEDKDKKDEPGGGGGGGSGGVDVRKESISISVTSQNTVESARSDEENSGSVGGGNYVRTRKQSIKKDLLLGRANSLKKAVRHLMEHSEKSPEPPFTRSSPTPRQLNSPPPKPSHLSPPQAPEFVLGPPPSSNSSSPSSTSPKRSPVSLKVQSPGLFVDDTLLRPSLISPLPDQERRPSDLSNLALAGVDLPVPPDFADTGHDAHEEHITNSLEASLSGDTRFTYHNPSDLAAQYNGVHLAKQMETKRTNKHHPPLSRQGTLDSDPETQGGLLGPHDRAPSFGKQNGGSGGTNGGVLDGILSGLKMSAETVSEMCHIDSSETSDISPEGSVIRLKYDSNRKASLLPIEEMRPSEDVIPRRHSEDVQHLISRKASNENNTTSNTTVSYPELDNPDIEFDASNLISTSPEDISDDDFRRELNFLHDGAPGTTLPSTAGGAVTESPASGPDNGGKRPCSIAHFVEGNDIARRSIKCRHMHRIQRGDNDEDDDIVTAVLDRDRDTREHHWRDKDRRGMKREGGPSSIDEDKESRHDKDRRSPSLLDRDYPVIPTIQSSFEMQEREGDTSLSTSIATVIERERRPSMERKMVGVGLGQYLDVPCGRHVGGMEGTSLLDVVNIRINGSNGTLATTTGSSNLNLHDSFDSTDLGSDTVCRRRSFTTLSSEYEQHTTSGRYSDYEHYSLPPGGSQSGGLHRPGGVRTGGTGPPRPPSVIVDPPSPPDKPGEEGEEKKEGEGEDGGRGGGGEGRGGLDIRLDGGDRRRFSYDSCRRLSAASPSMLLHSPQLSGGARRISTISTGDPTSISSPTGGVKPSTPSQSKTLPIINPLVRLPNWPNVSGSGGLISKVLLANADALCAAAVPLMDPDETLMEGFYERCVMNNYFGIGIDAQISLDFHHKREEHPEKCRSRARNYMWYGVLGSKQWLAKTYKNLEQRVQLECDGQRIPLPSLQGIVILNIPSFMGGTNFWGGTKEDEVWLAPSVDDKVLEVVAVFGTVQMAASRLINLQHHRIAQCQTIQINILGDEGVPIQVDGEAWVQPPGMIRIIHKNRMQMLCRNRALENSLKSWEEKQQRAQQRRNSQSKILPTPLADEELVILLGFIEVASSLVKSVKSLVLRHSSIEQDLYDIANTTSADLENVHPGGKLLHGLDLRPAVTQLVSSVRSLHEKTVSVLRSSSSTGGSLQLSQELETQLSTSLDAMETELNRCYLSHVDKFIHLSYEPLSTSSSSGKLLSPSSAAGVTFTAQKPSSSSHLSWLSFRRKSGDAGASSTKRHRSPSGKRDRAAAHWGVSEVSVWLESLSLGEYVETFGRNDIRGAELLTLTRRDLKDLGITKVA
uniref:Diacylglycerol kinase n=1 Tax=Cacopsylla melanoneura TaxID=428564 RepID=A0A8D8YU22_9HEMI